MLSSKSARLLLAALPMSIAQAHAQPNNDEVYELLTTAIHVQRSETALPVTVLSGKALHDAARATLGDTLAGQPGISNASFGPAVGQTVIRGQQGRRVLNLTNGISNADASGNSADHAQTTEAILARSVEVLRGPATLLYGGGAIGGVVNVIDNRISNTIPSAPSFAFEARHDSAADINTVVGSSDFSTGNLVWHLDGMQRDWNNLDIPGLAIDPRYLDSHDDEHLDHDEAEEDEHAEDNSNGYIQNTGGSTRNATVGLSWILANGHMGLAVTQLDNEYGLPPGVHGEHAENPEDEEEHHDDEEEDEFVSIDMQRTRYDFSGEWHDLGSWAETLRYQLSHTDYSHAEIEGAGAIGTRFSNDSWQQRLQLTHTDTELRHGVLGLQLSNESFAAIGEESFIPPTDIDSQGVFWIEDFHIQALTAEIGARLNRDRYRPDSNAAPDKDYSSISLSASGLWDMNANITVGLSVSRSQRAPSVEELYSNFNLTNTEQCVIHFATGACELGSAEFTKETSLNTDLSFYLDYGRLNASLTVFYNSFRDYIAQVSTGADAGAFPIREYRQDDARFSGIEVDANYSLNNSVSLRLFGDSINGRFDNYGDAPRMPPQRYGLEIHYKQDKISAYASVQHALQQDQPGQAELSTDSWSRIDIGADYQLSAGSGGELLFFIKARNLGDSDIRLSTSYLRGFAPEAGRSVETGIRYQY